jgi:transposase
VRSTEDVQIRMRDVLLQLALTSNGRTASYASSGGSETDYSPSLSFGDAPHLHFAKLWNAAETDGRREEVLAEAEETLDAIVRSHGDPGRIETKQELYARIVSEGEGWSARDVATRFRCGISVVWHARAGDGRDIEYGRRPRNGRALTADERQAEVSRLLDEGMSARQIANALRVGYNTVRRDLGRTA